MRRACLAAVAVAPLLAVAGGAFGACPGGPSSTNGADVELPSGCSVGSAAGQPGVTLNSSNAVIVDSGATISNTDVDNSVGILVNGGNTGSVTNSGAISLLMSYTPIDTNKDGLVNGPFATGENRYGIEVTGGAFNGSITNAGTITIDGNDSFGIFIAPSGSITGDIAQGGPMVVTGDRSAGLNIAGAVGGNLTVGGTVTVTGAGAQGLVTSAPVGGAVTIQNTITTTGYRSTNAPTTGVVLGLTPDELQQSGSAVAIGGDVGGGVTVGQTTTAVINGVATTLPAGVVATFGGAPAMQVGASGKTVSIGASGNPAEPYGVVIGGRVSGSGLYDQTTTPQLPAPVNATGLLVGSADGAGSAIIGGQGIHIQGGGAVTSDAVTANSTAIQIVGALGSPTSVPSIVNDGNIRAGLTVNAPPASGTPAPHTYGIAILAGANLPLIVNNRAISATAVTSKSGLTADTTAIADFSGSLHQIINAGSITANTSPLSNLFTTFGSNTAIDVRASTAGVSITQAQAAASAITGSISGTTLTVSAVGSGSVQVGDVITGPGVPGGTVITQLLSGDGGAGSTYSVNNSATVASQSLSLGAPSAKFVASISGTTLSVSSVTSGVLTPGQTISGPGVAPGTVIISEQTGTGGVGLYTVNQPQAVTSGALSGAVSPSIVGDILFGAGTNSLDLEAGRFSGALTELPGQSDLSITVNNATLNITKPEAHPLTRLNVGAGGVIVADINPDSAVGGLAPAAVFDTSGSAAAGVSATFAPGAQIGVSLDKLQTASSATYVFVHTRGPGDLSIGSLGSSQVIGPYLYTGALSQAAADLDLNLRLKTPAEMGFNASEAAAFEAIIAAAARDAPVSAALAMQSTRAGLISLYDQIVPDRQIGTFEALESATQHIAALTAEPPDAGVHVEGGSLWLQEVNQRVSRQTAETLGSDDKVFGLVGGYERMGAGGGALGLTLAYLNVENEGLEAAFGARTVADLIEMGAYYRRAWRGFGLSLRGAVGYAWYNDKNLFLTTGVSESAVSHWGGLFADTHVGASYEFRIRRFYLRPEIALDYLYQNQGAHNFGPGAQVVNVGISSQTDSRLTASAIVAFGRQYGQNSWFRPEIHAGYREVVAANFGDTIAIFNGGLPFTLSSGDVKGGWITAGFALKAGTELSYLALEGDADFRDNEQRYDIFFAGRAMF
ncbi:MAG: autotransporter outer membrane beta-barrel domain-containing protein [Caulobacteraceae bacterium]|nr:autotransporter outer membrane beta-barrel domain-containing protein [Caulobacteraceae bacterium]